MSGTPKSDKKYVKLPLTSSRLQLQLQRAVDEVLDTVRETPTHAESLVHIYIYLTSMIAAETMPTNYINHSKCHVLNRAQDTWDTLDTRQRDKRQATDDMQVDMVNVSAREVETLYGSAAAWLTRDRRRSSSSGGAAKRFIAKLSIKPIAVNMEVSLNQIPMIL